MYDVASDSADFFIVLTVGRNFWKINGKSGKFSRYLRKTLDVKFYRFWYLKLSEMRHSLGVLLSHAFITKKCTA